ncbi:MAG: hypothetical protein Q9168_002912 [Polycauliona sp. 1 TL-2023]
MPTGGAGERFTEGLHFFDLDQFNYIVGLKRVYPEISFEDLTTSFNERYRRHAADDEIENYFTETEKAANGEYDPTKRAEFIKICKFWPEKGFGKTDFHKLFILATFREAYEASIKLVKKKDFKAITTGIPNHTGPVSYADSNLRASKDFISYESLRNSTYKTLFQIYDDRMKVAKSS